MHSDLPIIDAMVHDALDAPALGRKLSAMPHSQLLAHLRSTPRDQWRYHAHALALVEHDSGERLLRLWQALIPA